MLLIRGATPMRRRILAIAPLFVLALAAATPASDVRASHPAGCPDGRYQVDGEPLLGSGEAISIDHGRIAIEGLCPAMPARLRALRGGGHALHARWEECGGLQNVVLHVYVAPGCDRMRGNLRSRWRVLERHFTATRCDDSLQCASACTTDAECGPAGWCARRPGDCGGEGRCIPLRDDLACPLYLDPVCGCDGQTYGNGCEAYAAGVNVARRGACAVACNVGEPCGDGRFCELPDGVCASGLDAGLCVDVPEACIDLWDPVCGCDGQTYGNDCDRRAAGVSKSHDGPCRVECEFACDCYADPERKLRDDCPLLCPGCGNYWSCEAGACVDRCGPIPPQWCPQGLGP
jgi:hypothetical protein